MTRDWKVKYFFFRGTLKFSRAATDHGTVATLQDRGYGTSSQEYSPSGLAEPVITSCLLHKFEVIFLFSGDKTTFEFSNVVLSPENVVLSPETWSYLRKRGLIYGKILRVTVLRKNSPDLYSRAIDRNKANLKDS